MWLSEIMLQQTTVAAVIPYFERFTTRWPTVNDLAQAEDEAVMAAWAGLGYYARARNLLKCARQVTEKLDGAFPSTEQGLRELPGVGPYTAAAVAAIAFDRPATVVDGNVERVIARIHAETAPLPGVKPVLRDLAARLTPVHRPGDYAQAVMDLGATICTPISPKCGSCPWQPSCAAHALGIAADLPARAPRKAKPVRLGVAWFALTPHGIVTVRRPEEGLLGGMRALPSSPWGEVVEADPPFPAAWEEAGEVRHTFTHFHLRLTVFCAHRDVPGAETMDPAKAEAAMPTVFAKAVRLGRAWADGNAKLPVR